MPEPEDDIGNLPREAILKNIGKVRVTGYRGRGYFWVLDARDTERLVKRERLTFLPSRGPSPS